MRISILASLLILAACKPDTLPGGHGGAPGTASQGDGSAPASGGAGCVLSGAPLCQDLAHACTMPGSAKDPACGYNPSNGLPGGAYCSAACGSCPVCRMRGVDGQPCEEAVEGSCYPGLVCVAGVCANMTFDGGVCVNCDGGAP